jgi:hypothetical protein
MDSGTWKRGGGCAIVGLKKNNFSVMLARM